MALFKVVRKTVCASEIFVEADNAIEAEDLALTEEYIEAWDEADEFGHEVDYMAFRQKEDNG